MPMETAVTATMMEAASARPASNDSTVRCRRLSRDGNGGSNPPLSNRSRRMTGPCESLVRESGVQLGRVPGQTTAKRLTNDGYLVTAVNERLTAAVWDPVSLRANASPALTYSA